MDFSWGGTERQKGVYDFGAYDTLLLHLKGYHMRAIWILDYGNPLYDGGLPPTSVAARNAMSWWAANATTHFKGNNILWEMWNEPNIPGFWPPTPNPKDYAALAISVGKAIKAATPQELFAGPATSAVDPVYLEAVFAAGTLEYYDAISFHPYRQTAPETATEIYATVRGLVTKYSSRTLPLVSGEWGYSDAWDKFDETIQSKYLPRMMMVNAISNIALSIWYDWHDDCIDTKNPECHFGTVRNEYAPNPPYFMAKPDYVTAQTLVSVLRGSVAHSTISANTTTWAVAFFDAQSKSYTYAAWMVAPSNHRTDFSFGILADDTATCFATVDYVGNAQSRVCIDKNRKIALSLDDSPLYVVPE